MKTVIKRSVVINANKTKVWNVLSDFGNIYKASKGVTKSYLTSKFKGVGTTRHCDLSMMGAQLEERITEYKEGESMKVEIYKMKNMPMMTDVIGGFKLTNQGKNTLMTGTFEYSMKNWFGDIMNTIMMRGKNISAGETFLAGLKHHIETGELMTSDTKVDTRVVSGG